MREGGAQYLSHPLRWSLLTLFANTLSAFSQINIEPGMGRQACASTARCTCTA